MESTLLEIASEAGGGLASAIPLVLYFFVMWRRVQAKEAAQREEAAARVAKLAQMLTNVDRRVKKMRRLQKSESSYKEQRRAEKIDRMLKTQPAMTRPTSGTFAAVEETKE
jgi:negative regulator of replication initiation